MERSRGEVEQDDEKKRLEEVQIKQIRECRIVFSLYFMSVLLATLQCVLVFVCVCVCVCCLVAL